MADAPTPPERSATTRVREHVRDLIGDSERVDAQEIANTVVEWLQTQPEVLDLFLYERVFDTATGVVRAVLLQTRRVQRMADLIDKPPEKQREKLWAWFDRMEHLGPKLGYARLKVMTAEELLKAAREREERAKPDLTHARWYRMLAAGLEPEQLVGERYSASEVERVYESAAKHVDQHLASIMDGAAEALDRLLNPDDDAE